MNKEKVVEKINIKNVVRGISIVLILLFFVPTFLVSCQGQDIGISAKTVTVGLETSVYGEKTEVVEPHFMAVIFLLLPIVLLGLWCVKTKLSEKMMATMTAVIATLDLILWLVMKAKVKEAASEAYCDFSIKGSFVFLIVLQILLLIIAVLMYLEKINKDTMILEKNSWNWLVGEKKTGWQCPSCNTIMSSNSKFCQKCGKEKPEVSFEDDDLEVSPKVAFCDICGSPIQENAKFCMKCGAKIEE